MPKLKKSRGKNKKKSKNVEDFGFRSILFSVILAGISLTISLFFNGEFISITSVTDNIIWQLVDILIRVFSILFFFLFMIIIIGNYKELTGKPITWKALTLIFILSIIQSVLDLKTFIITLIGLILLILYLYLTQ
jgi:hypothetical protein